MAKRQQGAEVSRLKGGRLRTPKGIARYAYVNSPDDSTYGKNRYRLTMVFDKADPEWKPFVTKLAALMKLHASELGKPAKNGNMPIKLVDEKMSKGKNGSGGTGDPVGAPYMEFESTSERRDGSQVTIPIFNAKGQEEPCQVYGGDIVRAEVSISGWLMPAGDFGIKGYLNAVQMLKSNWSGGAGSSFEAEDEYITEEEDTDELADTLDEEDDEPVFGDESGDGTLDEEDDDDTEEDDDDTEEEDEDPLAGLV